MSFEGEIGEIDLIQRLVELGSEQFTGAIRFESDGIIKIVYFKGGDVLSASTNDRTDAVDEILLRANKVTREHVKQALAKRKESETLGDALLGLGFITRKELTWARRVQVIGILRSIIGWKTGSYTIVADYLPKREEGTLFPLSQIIVELVVTDTDRTKSEQAMESGNAIFEKAPGFDDAFRRLGLNEDAEQIVAQIDGNSSAADVAARSGKDIFNVYKLLEALRMLKLITRTDKPPAEHEVFGGDAWNVENPDFTMDDVAPTVPIAAAAADAPRVDSATMEMPAIHVDPPAASSVWDDPADDDAFSGTELAPPPIAPAAEPQWSFDEAQIEAARRAAVPLHANDDVPTSTMTSDVPPPEPRKRSMLMPLLLLLLVAAGAYGGWSWWQKRQAAKSTTPIAATKPIATPPVTNTATAPAVTATNAGVSPATPPMGAITHTATTSAAPTTTTTAPTRVAATTTHTTTASPKTAAASTPITPKTTTSVPPRVAATTTTTAPSPRAAATTTPKVAARP